MTDEVTAGDCGYRFDRPRPTPRRWCPEIPDGALGTHAFSGGAAWLLDTTGKTLVQPRGLGAFHPFLQLIFALRFL